MVSKLHCKICRKPAILYYCKDHIEYEENPRDSKRLIKSSKELKVALIFFAVAIAVSSGSIFIRNSYESTYYAVLIFFVMVIAAIYFKRSFTEEKKSKKK